MALLKFVNANCDSEIYCRGPILEKIQMSGLFADSKQFVDMPTSQSKAVVGEMGWGKIQKPNLLNVLGAKKLCKIVGKCN